MLRNRLSLKEALNKRKFLSALSFARTRFLYQFLKSVNCTGTKFEDTHNDRTNPRGGSFPSLLQEVHQQRNPLIIFCLVLPLSLACLLCLLGNPVLCWEHLILLLLWWCQQARKNFAAALGIVPQWGFLVPFEFLPRTKPIVFTFFKIFNPPARTSILYLRYIPLRAEICMLFQCKQSQGYRFLLTKYDDSQNGNVEGGSVMKYSLSG